jgi:hypothetical protein
MADRTIAVVSGSNFTFDRTAGSQRHRTERNCGCEIAKYPTKGVLRDFARRDGDFHGT